MPRRQAAVEVERISPLWVPAAYKSPSEQVDKQPPVAADRPPQEPVSGKPRMVAEHWVEERLPEPAVLPARPAEPVQVARHSTTTRLLSAHNTPSPANFHRQSCIAAGTDS